MLDGIRPVQHTGNLQKSDQAVRTGRIGAAFSLTLSSDGIPPTPPAEVLQALDRVQRVAKELHARGLDVHFDSGGGPGVKVQVVDRAGSVVREVPVVQALDLFSGDRPLSELGV